MIKDLINKLKWKFYDIRLFIKSKYQLLRYGFEFKECWNFDYSLAKWTVPRLKHLRKNLNGHPIELTLEQWEEILDKIIFSFEYILNEDKYHDECYPKDFVYGFDRGEDGSLIWKDKRKPDYTILEKYEEQYNEGMKLFAQFFRNLWD